MSKLIRSSKHTTKYSNTNKKNNLSLFIDEYRRVATNIINEIWNNGYQNFNIKENQLQFPKFIDYNHFKIDTFLTARALSSLVTQVSGMIRTEVEKQRKRLFILNKLKENGASKKQRSSLAKSIKENIPHKPSCLNLKPELSSKCIDWQKSNNEFDGFLKLKSITKNKLEITIPIKFHKQSNKLKDKGRMLNSFLIDKKYINIRWKIDKPELKNNGIKIGIDQGIKDVITCSDQQKIKNVCPHGHSLNSILIKMSKKQKGSKAYNRCQKHRENFIHWSINQLNLKNIKEIRLEKLVNLGYKAKSSKYLRSWKSTLIRDKVVKICEENGVHLLQQSSTYRSQRCSNCGIVLKSNRKGKIYKCSKCGLEIDADFNASLNHVVDLPEIPYDFSKLKLNKDGFYWLETGLYDISTGKSLESLLLTNKDKMYI